jgi:hypothetical protein
MLNMSVVASIRLVRVLFPESKETDLVERLPKFEAIVKKNNKEDNMGKNQDYSQGYDIGEYLSVSGEDYDFKELDALGNELLEDFDYGELPVNDIESFKDGLANGYILHSYAENEKDR